MLKSDSTYTAKYIVAALKPVRAIVRDIINAHVTLGTWLTCLIGLYLYPDFLTSTIYEYTGISIALYWLWIVAVFTPPFLWLPYQWLLSRLMAARKRVSLSTGSISYRRFGIKRNHDTDLPHKFILLDHPWESFEKRVYALLGGKSRWLKHYCGRSKVLALEVMGEPHRITSIYGLRNSRKHLHKLNALTATIQAKARTGKGIAIDKEDEWSDEAGGLPS